MISTLRIRTVSRRLSTSVTLTLCIVVLLLAVPGPASATLCVTDVVPAATLLLPYFEVDLNSCGEVTGNPVELTTRFSIVNSGAEPVLAHVTLWTNVGIPAFAFDVYLAGFDAQHIDLGDLLCDGWLPTTGPGFTAAGPLSAPPVDFPGCNNGGEVGAAPAYGGSGAIDAARLADLQAAVTGQPLPSLGDRCIGIDVYGDNVGRGSATIDVVRACGDTAPVDLVYLDQVLAHDNVLTGTWEIISSANNFAVGTPLVHLEADTAGTTFAPGDVTFYGRFTDGSFTDRREPLPTTWAVRALVGGAFDGGTELLTWRESSAVVAGSFFCGTLPAPFPLDHSNDTGVGPLIAFDETSQAVPVPVPPSLPGEPEQMVLPFPFAAQSTRVMVGDSSGYWSWLEMPTPFNFGWLYLNLQQSFLPWGPDHGQSWITTRINSEGRFSGSVQAFPLDSSCTSATFNEAPAPMVVDNPALVGGLFIDGFESGDTTRWSTVVP